MVRIVQACSVALFVLLLLSSSQETEQAATFLQVLSRVARDTLTEEKCNDHTACGWAVYKPFTRNVEKYMRNTCNCPAEMACIRTDDDLSISAFVYRCRKQEQQNQEKQEKQEAQEEQER